MKQIVTPLGVGAHLKYWGLDQKKNYRIRLVAGKENQQGNCRGCYSSKAFSGRGISRAKTLWSSFVLKLFGFNIFIGSDSGYDSGFSLIGERYGSFDLAFLECGQYGKYWPEIHMYPEQTLMAGRDLQAKIIFPVHWGKFVLSTHPWTEPIDRLACAAEREGQHYVAPKTGEAFFINKKFRQEYWWNFDKKEAQ